MLSACFVPAYVLNRKELKPHFKEIIPLNAENYFRLLLYFRLFIRILLTVNKCSFKVTDVRSDPSREYILRGSITVGTADLPFHSI